MANILFKNSINYTPQIINKNYGTNYTVNLSSLKYSYCPPITFTGIPPSAKFDLKSILNEKQLMKIFKKQKEGYILLVHSEIETLAKAFSMDISTIEFSTANEALEKLEEYKNRFYKLIFQVENFVAERKYLVVNIPTNSSIRKISPYKEDTDKELCSLIRNLNDTLPEEELSLNDYTLDNEGYISFQKNHKVNTCSLYNYQKMQSFFKELVLSENEYYSDFKHKQETEYLRNVLKRMVIEKPEEIELKDKLFYTEEFLNLMYKKIDNINASPLFNKETFAMLYIKLEDFVEKEKAINNFVDKIIQDIM